MATKKVELTILSETRAQFGVGADDEGNVWVIIEYNGGEVTLPLNAFALVEDAVYDYIGESEGEEH